jgi:DNA-binding response OmpR family regulator
MIVLIEDDPRLGAQLKPEIERAGFVCEWARDAESGLRAIEREQPELILLDLMLPDRSGFEVLSILRRTSHIPVIVITAKVLGEDKIRALDLGADDYVTKPFWSDELTARMRAVLRRCATSAIECGSSAGAGAPNTIYRFGQVEIDLSAHTVMVGSDACHLTPTQFSLLKYFIERVGQALPSERIVSAVFQHESSATEALQTQISRLRKKLKSDGHCIKTVWGIGYRFDPDATTN